MMLATMLFTAATLLALGTIVVTLRQYAPAALALRGELQACAPMRDFRFRIVEVRRSAEVVALPFRFKRAAAQSGWRAAA